MEPVYDNHWVPGAVPGKIDSHGYFSPEHCEMYTSDYYANDTITSNCSSISFHTDKTSCDRWVFDEHEKTIVEEVNQRLNADQI